MPGSSHRFTLKEDRLAKQIAQEYINKGYSPERANSIGYATVTAIRERRYFSVPGNIRHVKVTINRKRFKV